MQKARCCVRKLRNDRRRRVSDKAAIRDSPCKRFTFRVPIPANPWLKNGKIQRNSHISVKSEQKWLFAEKHSCAAGRNEWLGRNRRWPVQGGPKRNRGESNRRKRGNRQCNGTRNRIRTAVARPLWRREEKHCRQRFKMYYGVMAFSREKAEKQDASTCQRGIVGENDGENRPQNGRKFAVFRGKKHRWSI